MTGSLQIKNNKYYAVLNFTGEDDKRRQKWMPMNLEVRGNRRKALEILRQLEESYDDKSLQAENLLLADYFAAWLERVKPTIEPCTYRSYSGNMNNHIRAISATTLPPLPSTPTAMSRRKCSATAPTAWRRLSKNRKAVDRPAQGNSKNPATGCTGCGVILWA